MDLGIAAGRQSMILIFFNEPQVNYKAQPLVLMALISPYFWILTLLKENICSCLVDPGFEVPFRSWTNYNVDLRSKKIILPATVQLDVWFNICFLIFMWSFLFCVYRISRLNRLLFFKIIHIVFHFWIGFNPIFYLFKPKQRSSLFRFLVPSCGGTLKVMEPEGRQTCERSLINNLKIKQAVKTIRVTWTWSRVPIILSFCTIESFKSTLNN